MDTVERFRKKIEREMRSGFIAILILHLIESSKEPRYGYSIIRELNRTTQDRLKFKEGTVYPILGYLQKQDFLRSHLGESPAGAPRKYYNITDKGKKALKVGIGSWWELSEILAGILEKMEVN